MSLLLVAAQINFREACSAALRSTSLPGTGQQQQQQQQSLLLATLQLQLCEGWSAVCLRLPLPGP